MAGSFNFGFEQKMMTATTTHKHCANFQRVCAKLLENGDLDILFGSEVGGFAQGFNKAGIDVNNILNRPFGKETVSMRELENYLAVCGFGGPAQSAHVSLHETAEIHHIPNTAHARAAITRFDVIGQNKSKAHVVAGNLHIVCGTSPPTIPARQKCSEASAPEIGDL